MRNSKHHIFFLTLILYTLSVIFGCVNFDFENNNLKEIIIPETVNTIGFSAFENNKLESVVIPSRKTIRAGAFAKNPIIELNKKEWGEWIKQR